MLDIFDFLSDINVSRKDFLLPRYSWVLIIELAMLSIYVGYQVNSVWGAILFFIPFMLTLCYQYLRWFAALVLSSFCAHSVVNGTDIWSNIGLLAVTMILLSWHIFIIGRSPKAKS